ncbi:MAG: 4-hydroxythreonine-4-phosphate dehydrogenase PdxA [Oligoflexus sp.]
MIFITMGDPFSVNIEILRKSKSILENAQVPVILIGSYWQWHWQGKLLSLPAWELEKLADGASLRDDMKAGVYFWDLDEGSWQKNAEDLSPSERGALAKRSLDVLQDIQLSRQTSIVTLPIDKKNCQMAGFSYPGQTEYCEALAGRQGVMILAGPRLKVGLVTNHLALKDVSRAISSELIQQKIEDLGSSLQKIYDKQHPRLAVVGLNPHCGDGGMFGDEDESIIRPAVASMRLKGWDVTGPIPADTAFFHAYQGRYDAVLAMYHDQGLGPLKTVHFYDAVNITGGLDFLRVSPDHGPATDLFGKSQANAESIDAALKLALRYQS